MLITIKYVVSWLILILGMSYLLQGKMWIKYINSISEKEELFYPIAVLLLMAGLIILSVHNVWVLDWSVAITITGWSLVIKSTLFLIAPGLLLFYRSWPASILLVWMRAVGALLVVVGCMLVYRYVFSTW